MTAPGGIRDRYPTPGEFREAIDSYWGAGGWFRWKRDARIWFAACPGCRSKPLRRESLERGFPLIVWEATGGYCVDRLCGCAEGSIVGALDGTALSLAMGYGDRETA